MPLKETYRTITLPKMDYLYVEKPGPFMHNAPSAWQELWKIVTDPMALGIQSVFSRYRLYPEPIYRACIGVKDMPSIIPDGLRADQMPSGNYIVFTLIGSYSQLPDACGRVDEIISEKGITPLKDYHMERYVSDPRETPTEDLITEILVPVL